MNSIGEVLAALIGQRIPGGCDDCDAYQTMQTVDGIFILSVHHDDTCPTLHRIEGRQQ